MFITFRVISAKLLLYSLLVTAGLLLISEPAWAQHTITAHSDVLITADSTDFDAEEKVTTNHHVDWTGWDPMIIEIKSLSADLGDSDDFSYTKPLSDFLWKVSWSETWTAVTSSFVTVYNKTGPGPAGGYIDMEYKFLLYWASDKPGSYTANLQYQITST